MPNFLIIGAPQSGTSSLYVYLGEHPDVYMSPIKEPAFFAYEGTLESVPPPHRWRIATDLDDYKGLFRDVTDEKAIGEGSTSYLSKPHAPERIKHHIPAVRMIAILRNPIDRAYSQWLHRRRAGIEVIADFWEAIERELSEHHSTANVRSYIRAGSYAKHLERYMSLFEPNRMRIYLHEDFSRDPLAIVADAYRFLGVDDSFVPHIRDRYNAGGIPRSRRLYRLLTTSPVPVRSLVRFLMPPRLKRKTYLLLWRFNMAAAPPLSDAVRHKLIPFFEQDVRNLSVMLRRDLSHWLGQAPAREQEVPNNPGIHPSPISAL